MGGVPDGGFIFSTTTGTFGRNITKGINTNTFIQIADILGIQKAKQAEFIDGADSVYVFLGKQEGGSGGGGRGGG